MTPATLAAAADAPTHPALRWTPALSPDGKQHRRHVDGDRTVCGRPGPLTLAETNHPRCESGCWG